MRLTLREYKAPERRQPKATAQSATPPAPARTPTRKSKPKRKPGEGYTRAGDVYTVTADGEILSVRRAYTPKELSRINERAFEKKQQQAKAAKTARRKQRGRRGSAANGA